MKREGRWGKGWEGKRRGIKEDRGMGKGKGTDRTGVGERRRGCLRRKRRKWEGTDIGF